MTMRRSTWLAAALAATVAIGAPAQNTQPIDNFSLPATQPTPVPVQNVSPQPSPSPSPTPSSTSAPPAPAPTATPRPAATAPAVRPTPAATPMARPTPRVTPTPATAGTRLPAPTPGATPTAAPDATTVLPAPAATPDFRAAVPPVAMPAPSRTASPEVGATDGGDGLPSDAIVMLSAIVGAIAILSGYWFWRRRQRALTPVASTEVAPDVPAPSPAPPAAPPQKPAFAPEPAVAPPADAPPPEGQSPAPVAGPAVPRPWLDIEIAPRRAGTNLTGISADFDFAIGNIGQEPARNVRVAVHLLTSNEDQDARLSALIDAPIRKPLIAPFDLAPDAVERLSAVTTLPFDEVYQVMLLGRPMMIPIVAIVAHYDWGGAGQGTTARSFILGIRRPEGDRLAPFWLDRGPRMFDTIGQRQHSVGRLR